MRTLLVAFMLILVAGCVYRNQSQECTQEINTGCPTATPFCDIDGRFGVNNRCVDKDPRLEPTECESNADCNVEDRLPACDKATKKCASCMVDQGVCTANTVCRVDGACGCAKNADCASKICDASAAPYGECVKDTDIIYVAQGGMDMMGCGAGGPLGMACNTIQFGVDEAGMNTRLWVHVAKGAGAYLESVSTNGQTVNIVGENRPEITGQGADVPTFKCTGGKLGLYNMRLFNGLGLGVDATGGCEIDVRQSEIDDNNGGGVSLDDGKITLINNVIVANGTLNVSLVGGVGITGNVEGTIAFNTIINNLIANNANSAGVDCGNLQPTVVATSNLVQSNTAPVEKRQAGGGDRCAWSYSALSADDSALGGDNNKFASCMVSAVNGRLSATDTVCKNAGDPEFKFGNPALRVEVDIDGEPRPSSNNPNPDIGADELQ